MRTLIISAVALATLALPARAQDVAQQVQAANAECEALHDRHVIKTASATVDCFVEKLQRISANTGVKFSPEDNLRLAKMRELAEKVDRRLLTKAEAKLQYAEYDYAIRQRQQAQTASQAELQRQQQETEAQIRALERQAEIARQAQQNQALFGAAQMLGAFGGASRLPYGAYRLP
jgi:hypothetical protein